MAFSSNNTGNAAVALNCMINFTKAVKMGDTLIAESILMADTRKTAVYDIAITNQHKIMVASFRGTVYKLDKKLLICSYLKFIKIFSQEMQPFVTSQK